MGNKTLGKKNPLYGFFSFALAALILTVPASASGSVRINAVTEKISEQNLDCQVKYPQLSGLKNTDAQEKLNVGFLEMAKGVKTEAIYNAKSGAVKASMDFTVTRNEGGIMSLVVNKDITSTSGRNPDKIGVTVDTVTGRRYLLNDLFIDNADYVATLSDAVRSLEKTGTTDSGSSQPVLSISNNACFYLTSDKLVVVVRQGKISDSDCTVKEFAIPLKQIKEILKPQFSEKL